MRFPNGSCADCCHTAQCSKQTRMYINYCGADRARVIDRIRKAQSECAGRRGPTMVTRQGGVLVA